MADQFRPLSSIVGLPKSVGNGRGVVVRDRDGIGLATVLCRREGQDALSERIRSRYGLNLPLGPTRVGKDGIAFAEVGPRTWLAAADGAANGFATSLSNSIGDLAAVVDQTDGYAALRLSGKMVRQALAKGFMIDLHPRKFRRGDVASTSVAHIGATIWRLDDGPDGFSAFEVVVFRSLMRSFWHWLAESSAEFGLAVEDFGRG